MQILYPENPFNFNQKHPLQYSTELPYSEGELEKTVEKAASFVGRIYSKFPRLSEEEKEKLENMGMLFGKLEKPPSISECKKFEAALKQKVMDVIFNKEKDLYGYTDNSIAFSTHFSPEKKLKEIAESIFENTHQLRLFFPYKTIIEIRLNEEEKKLYIEMRLKPSFK